MQKIKDILKWFYNYYFNYKGRISVGQWALNYFLMLPFFVSSALFLILLSPILILNWILINIFGVVETTTEVFPDLFGNIITISLLSFWFILCAYSLTCINIKRLKDQNKPWWLALIFLIPVIGWIMCIFYGFMPKTNIV